MRKTIFTRANATVQPTTPLQSLQEDSLLRLDDPGDKSSEEGKKNLRDRQRRGHTVLEKSKQLLV